MLYLIVLILDLCTLTLHLMPCLLLNTASYLDIIWQLACFSPLLTFRNVSPTCLLLPRHQVTTFTGFIPISFFIYFQRFIRLEWTYSLMITLFKAHIWILWLEIWTIHNYIKCVNVQKMIAKWNFNNRCRP